MWEEVDLTYLGDDDAPFVGPHGSCAIWGLSKTTQMKRVYIADHGSEYKCVIYDMD